jgi:protein CpxP
MNNRKITTAGLVLVTALLAAVPAFTSASAAPAAQSAESTAQVTREEHRAEARITSIHNRLRITEAQEPSWGKVAQIMRDNAIAFRAAVRERHSAETKPTAVDDLKSFQIVADEHSAGLKKLIPAFETLYAALTAEQQKRADRVFDRRQRD